MLDFSFNISLIANRLFAMEKKITCKSTCFSVCVCVCARVYMCVCARMLLHMHECTCLCLQRGVSQVSLLLQTELRESLNRVPQGVSRESISCKAPSLINNARHFSQSVQEHNNSNNNSNNNNIK